MNRPPALRTPRALAAAGVLTVALMASGCSVLTSATTRPGVIAAVGAENEYADVISQIGGQYVQVTAIMDNPNTDPHSFEASPQVAEDVSAAQLVVQNGLGYDTFMNRIEAAAPDAHRKVVDVQTLLGLPDATANPHLWYKPTTMPAVANAVADDLAELDPDHAALFHANARRFVVSLAPWYAAIAKLKADFPNVSVATTEPVGDYLLEAAGTVNRTPWALQADIMNGVDPSPQDVSIESDLLSQHQVRVFVYNQQVTDSLTQSFLNQARSAGIPVVGVFETMPTPGYTYQSWMLAETEALQSALADNRSTEKQ
jgi:zinc/manganese transport system substrate-binding protein